MSERRHIMIDLETMSLEPNAAIVSIGAVEFTQDAIVGEFYTPVNLDDGKALGLNVNPDTVTWWAQQAPEARSAWDVPDAPTVLSAMGKFAAWLPSDRSYICPWGNGADFDLVVINSALRALDIEPIWKYYNHHCFRTLKNLFRVQTPSRSGTYHNALDDARTQALHAIQIFKEHGITLT